MTLPRSQTTTDAIARFVANPSHALLITGPNGIGKGSVAREIAEALVGAEASNTSDRRLVIDTPTIGIEAIRDVTQFLRLKSTGKQRINRVIIIEHAEHMTPEAQNALLKLLEEPPADTVLLLTAPAPALLLPTIVSRMQQLTVGQTDKATIDAYFESHGFKPADITRAYTMSGGMPGLMHSILAADGDHPLLVAAQNARAVLQATTFDRLCLVDQLSKQRELCIDVCDMLGHMATLSLQNPNLPPAAGKRWLHILKASHMAADDLRHYAQSKLVLSRLFLAF